MAWSETQKESWREIPVGSFFVEGKEGFIPVSTPTRETCLKIAEFGGIVSAARAAVLTKMADKIKALAQFAPPVKEKVNVSVDDAELLRRIKAGELKVLAGNK